MFVRVGRAALILALGLSMVLAMLPLTAFAFDYGDLDTTKMPPDGWKNVQWQDPGNWTTINVNQNGIPANDTTVNAAQEVLDILSTTSGNRILYFPEGTYYFDTDLSITASNVRIVGDGMTKTVFHLSGPSSANVEISFTGSTSGTAIAVSGSPARGDQSFTVSDASTLSVGDMIQLYLKNGATAYGFYNESQILEVTAVNGNTITVDMKLGIDFPSADTPEIIELDMVRNVGISDMKVIRDTAATSANTNNIEFWKVYNGYAHNIESAFAERSHINAGFSKNIVIEHNLVHEAFDYGGGGQGYGIMLEIGTTGARVSNNRAYALRHHYLIQLGANHNVFSYNVSEPDYKHVDDNDFSVHGDYPHNNLFEGNVGSNIEADNAHGSNGPNNTYFRNDAGSIQIRSLTGYQNIIGNLAAVSTESSTNYVGANSADGNTIDWGSLNSNSAIPDSLYLTTKPDFFGTNDPWPVFGPGVTNWGTGHALPAVDIGKAYEVIVDNADTSGVTSTGTWTTSTYSNQRYGTDYWHDGNTGQGTKSATFTPDLDTTGTYDVYMWWPADTNRASNVPVDIAHAGGTATVTVNQQINGQQWNLIGSGYSMNAGTGHSVTVRTDSANGYVMADAVKFVLTETAAGTTLVNDTFDGGTTGQAPAGWAVTGSGGTVTVEEVPGAADKSMDVNDTSTTATVQAEKTFTAQTGTVTVEFEAKAGAIDQTVKLGYLYGGTTNAVSVYFRNSGHIYYYDGNTYSSAQTFAANTWYTFKIVADVAADTYDLYIDDMNTPVVTGASFRNAVSSIDKIQFGSIDGETGKVHVNNVYIHTP